MPKEDFENTAGKFLNEIRELANSLSNLNRIVGNRGGNPQADSRMQESKINCIVHIAKLRIISASLFVYASTSKLSDVAVVAQTTSSLIRTIEANIKPV